MMMFTHFEIGFNLYWQNRKKLEKQTFKLNPVRFIYGNMKPDLCEMARLDHHLSETYDCFQDHWKMANDVRLTDDRRSEALGVAAHFISDYFCLYHAKAPYNHYHIIRHFFYEFKLHVVGEIRGLKEWFIGIKETVDHDKTVTKSFEARLVEMLAAYHEGEESCLRDLSYTYTTLDILMATALEKEENYANSHIHGHLFTSGERRNQYA